VTEPKHAAGGAPRHAAPEGADRDPLIDMDRDPTPGVPDHAAQEEPGESEQNGR
jgi:hypothetical protein